MNADGVEVGMRFETRAGMRKRYDRERADEGCAECPDCRGDKPCTCRYECAVCGAVSHGRPSHPGGVCPDA